MAGFDLTGDDFLGDEAFELVLDHAAEGAGTVLRVETAIDEVVFCRLGDLEAEVFVGEALGEIGDEVVKNLADFLAGEGMENDDAVETVDQLGAHDFLQRLHSVELVLLVFVGKVAVGGGGVGGEAELGFAEHLVGAEVGGEDDDGVVELDAVALAVGEGAILEDLQQ